VNQLVSQHEQDLQKYLSAEALAKGGRPDADIGLSQNHDTYYEQLNQYLSDADWGGLAGKGSDPLSALTENAALHDDFSRAGLQGIDGLETGELEQLLSDYGSLDAGQLDQRIDALAQHQDALRALQKETAALENLKSEQLAQLEHLQGMQGQAQQFNKNMTLKKGRVMANEHIMNNTEIVETAMKQTDGLKRKYAFVNSASADGEELDQPVRHVQTQKRFFYGSDVQLLPGDPFGIDFAATAGYRTGNRTAIGLAASIRQEFSQSENYMPNLENEPVYGGRFFFQYKALRSFYLQGETEAVSVYDESARKLWEFNYLAGIGRSMPIKNKVRLNVAFLYHINNKNSLAHDKPFVVRIGLGSM
jgi:hypothetical protein